LLCYFLDILQALPALFRSADLLKFTGNANVFLTRALERAYITRLTRGVYVNSRLKAEPSLEEAACFVRTPSYISAEWALHKHGVIIQVPTVCTVVTLSTAVGITRNLHWRGVTIEYSHISDRLYFGFEARDGFNLAMPELRHSILGGVEQRAMKHKLSVKAQFPAVLGRPYGHRVDVFV